MKTFDYYLELVLMGIYPAIIVVLVLMMVL